MIGRVPQNCARRAVHGQGKAEKAFLGSNCSRQPTMPTDFRDGKTFPRRGREALGDFFWLRRGFDKARAENTREEGGRISPRAMERPVIEVCGGPPPAVTTPRAGATHR